MNIKRRESKREFDHKKKQRDVMIGKEHGTAKNVRKEMEENKVEERVMKRSDVISI